jgi:hypothetical protein
MGKVRKDESDEGSNDEGIARQSGSDDDGESSHRHKHGPNLATGKRPPAKPVLVVWPDGSERPVPVAPPKELRRLISLAQCDAASTERGAWHLALHADPDPNDLLAVRVCAEKGTSPRFPNPADCLTEADDCCPYIEIYNTDTFLAKLQKSSSFYAATRFWRSTDASLGTRVTNLWTTTTTTTLRNTVRL